jgi:hypothetical protein
MVFQWLPVAHRKAGSNRPILPSWRQHDDHRERADGLVVPTRARDAAQEVGLRMACESTSRSLLKLTVTCAQSAKHRDVKR